MQVELPPGVSVTPLGPGQQPGLSGTSCKLYTPCPAPSLACLPGTPCALVLESPQSCPSAGSALCSPVRAPCLRCRFLIVPEAHLSPPAAFLTSPLCCTISVSITALLPKPLTPNPAPNQALILLQKALDGSVPVSHSDESRFIFYFML